ncbi:23S rRNA (guanosine(2251)-2'-O)-methyltransferase RlmB [Salsipaludibacter albus]|uniref:23S rRNA (guanosine(2251)-2'-O)-methyltransferase RlmB n=1 Tax=Salsipaludibacter albus TaxID=2849650 RepID=UPI001EE3D934|nr:23S rRNA (guanosine(2251)-2'-O)-methyltransferase RlmB [Salsipaludibacter albus]
MSDRDDRVVVGIHPVRELLRAGRAVREVLVADRSSSEALDEIRTRAAGAGVPIRPLDDDRAEALAPGQVHQGVVALAPAFPFQSLDQVLARGGGDQPLLLVAFDQVTDPHNVGSVARTAEALGAHALVLPERRTASITPTVEKAAAGALAHLPVVSPVNLAKSLEKCRDAGLWLVGLEAGTGTAVADCNLLTEPLVLVVGAEGTGLRPLTRTRCDVLVELPLHGHVDSYNASVAAAMALYAIDRARRSGGGT